MNCKWPIFENLVWTGPKDGSCYAPTIPQCFKCPIPNVQTTWPVFENLGWTCPKCGLCYAPTIPQCFKCPIPNVQTTTTTTPIQEKESTDGK
jgi:hypothetical protein